MSWAVTNLDRRFTLRWLGSRCLMLRLIGSQPQSAIHFGQAREHRDARSLRSEGEARPDRARWEASLRPLVIRSTTTCATNIKTHGNAVKHGSCLHASMPGRIKLNGTPMQLRLYSSLCRPKPAVASAIHFTKEIEQRDITYSVSLGQSSCISIGFDLSE